MLPTAINDIKNKILDTVDVSKIYLFGSYAQGTQTAQSDYDFVAVNLLIVSVLLLVKFPFFFKNHIFQIRKMTFFICMSF